MEAVFQSLLPTNHPTRQGSEQNWNSQVHLTFFGVGGLLAPSPKGKRRKVQLATSSDPTFSSNRLFSLFLTPQVAYYHGSKSLVIGKNPFKSLLVTTVCLPRTELHILTVKCSAPSSNIWDFFSPSSLTPAGYPTNQLSSDTMDDSIIF